MDLVMIVLVGLGYSSLGHVDQMVFKSLNYDPFSYSDGCSLKIKKRSINAAPAKENKSGYKRLAVGLGRFPQLTLRRLG